MRLRDSRPEGTSEEPPESEGPLWAPVGPTAESEVAHSGGQLTKRAPGRRSHPPLTATKGSSRNRGGASTQGEHQPWGCPGWACEPGSAPPGHQAHSRLPAGSLREHPGDSPHHPARPPPRCLSGSPVLSAREAQLLHASVSPLVPPVQDSARQMSIPNTLQSSPGHAGPSHSVPAAINVIWVPTKGPVRPQAAASRHPELTGAAPKTLQCRSGGRASGPST